MVIGVVVGYLLWTAVWLGGNALLFGAATASVTGCTYYSAAGPLAGLIALSLLCSASAGAVAARIVREHLRGAVLTLAVLLLCTGIAVQTGIWAQMPTWYHLTFLALIAPTVVVSGRLFGRTA